MLDRHYVLQYTISKSFISNSIRTQNSPLAFSHLISILHYKTTNPITPNPTSAHALPPASFPLFAAPVYCAGAVALTVIVPTILKLVAVTVLVPVTLPLPLAVSTLNTELKYWLLSAEPFALVRVVEVTSVEVDVVVVMSVEFELVDGEEDEEGERPR
jgi:hypothetical protein